MPIGIDLGDFGLGDINVGPIIDKLLLFIGLISLILIVSAIAYFFLKKRRDNQNSSVKKIGWWEEIQDKLIPVSTDEAKEIIIPGTRLRVFYIKSKDMWLPRFARGLTKDLFYVAITAKREMVNFTLKTISSDMKEAGLDYDHTDMIWASENLREFVKRNYRDKSTPWWKEFQGVITTAIFIVLLTVSFSVILYFMRQLIGDISSLIGGVEKLLLRMESLDHGSSGIAPAFMFLLIPKFIRKNKE